MLGRMISRRALLRVLPVALVGPAALATRAVPQGPVGTCDASVQDVAPALMRAICEHCVAFVNYRNLVRNPTSANLSALGDAIDAERSLLLDVATFQATNEVERTDQANYLSAFRRCNA